MSELSLDTLAKTPAQFRELFKGLSWQAKLFFAFWLLCAGVGLANIVSEALSRGQAAPIIVPDAAAAMSPTLQKGGIIPVRLLIPSIGLQAKVERVGEDRGAMATPANFEDVGWYELGSEPGAQGTAVIDGHVNNALTSAGVFEHLRELKLGDKVTVEDASGAQKTFLVDSEQIYDPNAGSDIFAQTGPSRIALVTCDGEWNAGKHMFDERLVVFATLAQ